MPGAPARVLAGRGYSVISPAGVIRPILAATFTEFPIPTANSEPTDITVGSLFAVGIGNSVKVAAKIGRITPAGEITEYPLPANTLAGAPGITVGPDGALWFTLFGANQIGRITTAGVITTFQ